MDNPLVYIPLNILAVAVIVGGWLYLRQYLSTHKHMETARIVYEIVRAAEQQFLDNAERRAWAIDEAKRRLPGLQIDLLITLIEAAVYDLNAEQAEDAAIVAVASPRRWVEADA